MEKSLVRMLCILAAIIAAIIAVGCDDGNGWVATDDATVDSVVSCPSSADGVCTEDITENGTDTSTSDVVEEVAETDTNDPDTVDIVQSDACTPWAWLEGTKWLAAITGFYRFALWVDSEDESVCMMQGLHDRTGDHAFIRNINEYTFVFDPPPITISFNDNGTGESPLTLVTESQE